MPDTIPAIGLRYMMRRDYPEVLAIEQASFAAPWTEADFLRVLRRRSCIGMIAERRTSTAAVPAGTFQTLGYMVYELGEDWIEVHNLAVAPAERRSGIGSYMLAKLKAMIGSRKRRITAKVHDANLGAHLLLHACGFVALDVWRGYCEDGSDAYLFAYEQDW